MNDLSSPFLNFNHSWLRYIIVQVRAVMSTTDIPDYVIEDGFKNDKGTKV